MTALSLINIGVTLTFAVFVMASTLCRITQVDMKLVRYVYVAPILMMFAWSASVFFSLIGGDTPDWYQPLCLFALVTHLWTTRFDWENGVPHHMLRRTAYVQMLNGPVRVVARVRFENYVVAFFTVCTMGAAAVGALDGRGNPLQIYSAMAKPSVTVPGGTLQIVYSLRRVRVCPGYVDRFIINADTQDVAQTFGSTPIGGSEVGVRRDGVTVTLKLGTLPVGRYFYRATIYHNCPDAEYAVRSPDVPFVIAPAEAAR